MWHFQEEGFKEHLTEGDVKIKRFKKGFTNLRETLES